MAQECMNIFEKEKLAAIGEVEQNMACRQTAEGEYPKKLVKDLLPLLDDSSIRYVCILRAYVMYT
jgi:syntaxin-binding protein 1